MKLPLYILLGVLVVGLVIAQTWIARSSSDLAGDRGRLVRGIRMFNVVLLVAAIALAVYAMTLGR